MKHRLLKVGLPVLALGAAAYGQTSVERFERQLQQIERQTRIIVNPEVPAGQRAMLDYGGFLSFNFFAIDDELQNTHVLRQYDLVGYARLNIDNVHEFFIRARTAYNDWNSGDSFDGNGDQATWPTVEQAFYRFDLARYLGAYKGRDAGSNNLVFQGGRQFVYWANGMVLAETLDGVNLDLAAGPFAARLLAGATANGIADYDPTRPDFDQETARDFFGAMLAVQLGRHRPFVYGLIQKDKNEDERLVDPALGNETKFRYDSWYLGVGANGSIGDRLVYGVEFAYEGGEGYSNSFEQISPTDARPVNQTKEDIQAWALDLRLDYLVSDARRTRFSGELMLASGDDDRGLTNVTFDGNRPGTDDNAFNAWGLLNTGLAFAPAFSNLTVLRVGASTFPFTDGATFRRLQAGLDVLVYGKFDSNAPISERTTDDWFLGFEPDLYINWRITSDITLAVRYGVFFPGTAIVEDDHPRHFLFTGVTFAF